MNSAALFTRLCHLVRNYDDASLLCVLLSLGADQEPVKTTAAKLAQYYMVLPMKRIQRSTLRLVEAGLLTVRVYPKTSTEYSLNSQALMALLQQPLPNSRWLPGLSESPTPFLAELKAKSVLDAVSVDLTSTIAASTTLSGATTEDSQ